ncbi:MAG: DUF2268 domain-containing putative Zn-dependent protease [Steroidobacteraceae bacterium]
MPLARIMISVAIGALLIAAIPQAARAAPPARPTANPVIHIEDVARFYKLYDASGGHPGAAQLQDYIDRGSDGLRYFARARNTTGARIASAIEAHPAMYADARRCVTVLPRVRVRVAAALQKLKELYPEAKLLPVTIVIGRGKPVAIGDGREGVEAGLESLCEVGWMNSNLEDRFVHVIAHEYGHVQQFLAFDNDEHPTVLEGSLMEGAAEFIAEMTSGDISYSFFRQTTQGRNKEIETAFAKDEDSTDLSRWLYNGTLEKPGDLGYWVGYRICKAYYQHAANKRQAFRDIVEISDPKLFLAKSGWYPGIELQ